jgi:site-specific recombinase XerD
LSRKTLALTTLFLQCGIKAIIDSKLRFPPTSTHDKSPQLNLLRAETKVFLDIGQNGSILEADKYWQYVMNKKFRLLLALIDNLGYNTNVTGQRHIRAKTMAEHPCADRALVGEFYKRCRILNLSRNTLNYYAQNLSYLILLGKQAGVGAIGLQRGVIEAEVVRLLDDGLSPVSINTRLRAWKVFYKFLHKESDKSMVMVAVDGMLRRGEIANLGIGDVELGDRILRVNGKSRRERLVPISSKTARSIHSYLLRYRQKMSGSALFCLSQTGARLSGNRIYKIFKRHARRTGIDFCPHALRRTGATLFINNGGGLSVCSRILGHSDTRVTMNHYINHSTRDLIESHDRFSPMGGLR